MQVGHSDFSLGCLLIESLWEGSAQHLLDFGHLGCLSRWGLFYWSWKHSPLREGAARLDNSYSVDSHLPVQGWTCTQKAVVQRVTNSGTKG